MKLRILNLPILLVMLLGLAACGGNATPTATAVVTKQDPTGAPTVTTTAVGQHPTTAPTATAMATKPEPSATPTEIAPAPSATPTTRPGCFSREQLIEDARQLADIIESTHPDPYTYGGGKVAFHCRLQHVLNSIPAEGMTEEEFTRLLIPFVAGVGDGHTVLDDEYSDLLSRVYPGGVPLHLRVIEENLYVAGVPQGIDTSLLGSLLISVEGIPVAELCERQGRMEGTDNQYHALQSLLEESIYYEPYMQDLIPEWEDTSCVTVELQRPTGEIGTFTFDLPMSVYPQHTSESQVALPSTGLSDFTYEFLDEERQLAYLRVDSLQHYAEGNSAGLGPSATEMFREMVLEMEEAGTETLIVDLRINEGGSSVLGDILVYFLYGKEAVDRINSTILTTGGCGSRLSDAYFKYYSGDIGLEDVDQSPMIVMGDYDFSRDFSALQEIYQETPDPAEILSLIDAGYADNLIWYEEYQAETYSGYYLPDNVLVLVSSQTYSSGANVMQFLSRAGAALVGTPSSQVTNSFGEVAPFALDNTRISGWVSTKYCVQVPPDSDAARVWPVDYPLTYEKLAAYDFDPNAEYLYALELLPELGETAQAPIATEPEQTPGAPPTETAPAPTATPTTRQSYFSREQLIEDARQLADSIESAHPDPYIRGGGMIAFHRRLQHVLNSIPVEGMTREEFIRLLRPFVAAVGDAHTEIWSDYRVNDYAPGGVPLRLGIVEQSLYVTGFRDDTSEDLIGATLLSVEGVPLAELCERQKRLVALENEYHVLEELASHTLWYEPYLQDLLPEWEDTGEISVELQLPSGQIEGHTFTLPKSMLNLHTPNSQVSLPSTGRSGFRYDLLDAEGKIAYLRVDHLTNYREAREMETNQPAPHLPSATETFRSMVVEMEEAETDTLIIDLRGNQGGHSVMGDILTYFLYGKETLQDIMVHGDSIGGGMVRKYSDLFWERTQSWTSLEQVNQGRALPLRVNDYDFAGFSGDVEWSPERKAEAIAHSENAWLARSPTFWEEYQSEAYSGYYRPKTVFVLVDPWTFSSGFTLAKYLYLAGATFIGTPSSQAANSFGNGQLWRLDHTGLEGTVSTTYSIDFPDDSELARVLPVHYPLTYEKLASYDFDPNAVYLYALELLSE